MLRKVFIIVLTIFMISLILVSRTEATGKIFQKPLRMVFFADTINDYGDSYRAISIDNVSSYRLIYSGNYQNSLDQTCTGQIYTVYFVFGDTATIITKTCPNHAWFWLFDGEGNISDF